MIRKLVISLSVLVSLPAAAILIDWFILAPLNQSVITNRAIYFILHEMPFRGANFSVDAWRAAGPCAGLDSFKCGEGSPPCPRGPMVNDLIEQHFEIGVTKSDTFRTLLGEPDFETREYRRVCPHQYVGFCSGFQIDRDSFFACFDDEDLLIDVGHMQH